MRLRTTALMIGLVAVASLAEATIVVPSDLRTLTGNAQAIARGRVVDVRSQWAEANNRIETVVTVEVDSYLKGNLGARFIFRVPGGKVGYLRSVMVGAPVLREGDEIVVFVRAKGPAVPHVVGFNQGVFRVAVDARSGRRVVASPLLSAEVRGPNALARGSRRPVELSNFERQVRALVGQDEAATAKPRAAMPGRGRR